VNPRVTPVALPRGTGSGPAMTTMPGEGGFSCTRWSGGPSVRRTWRRVGDRDDSAS